MRITGRKARGFFLLEQNKKVNLRCALLALGLIVLCAIALDGTRKDECTDNRRIDLTNEPHELDRVSGIIQNTIGRLSDHPNEPAPPRRFSTARPRSFDDKPDQSATRVRPTQSRIDCANKNTDGDDLEDATDDSQDDAGESKDDADNCVE